MEPYTYIIRSIDKVIDGDTIDITIDLGFLLYHSLRIRMNSYDAPETFRPHSPIEFEAGKRVKDYLTERLTYYFNSGAKLFLKSSVVEIYNRWGGEIIAIDKNGVEFSINNEVIIFMTVNKLTKKDLGLI